MTDNNPYVRRWRAKGWLPPKTDLSFDCADCNAGDPEQCMKASFCQHRDGPKINGEALARRFHDTYERLAPSFGYETRADTKAFDPTTPNGKLMIAVCNELAPAVAIGAGEVEITPRRPLDDDKPDGYMESDKDFVLNNITACVALLEAALAARPSTETNNGS